MKNKIAFEKQTVEMMVRLYCRHAEKNATLCPACGELLSYAHERLSSCQFGEGKPACKNCPIHCYKADMRERIRQVMRFSGPRMILHAPVRTVRHMWLTVTAGKK